jgi:hypothetical protein
MIVELIISHVIAGLIGVGLGWSFVKVFEKLWSKRVQNFSSEHSMALHEIGHMLAWLKYCPWWNNKYAYEHHAERMEHVAINKGKKCGHLRFYERKVDPDDETKSYNKNLLIGGTITEMALRNRPFNRLTMFIYEYMFGCHDDMRRLRDMGMTNKEIIALGRQQMTEIDEYDREFIEDVAKDLQWGRCKDDEGWKIMSDKELKRIAKVYYSGEKFSIKYKL